MTVMEIPDSKANSEASEDVDKFTDDSSGSARLELLAAREELKRAKETAANYSNKLKHLMADYDNMRKQLDRQAIVRIESTKAELLLKFLNVRDDYQRALSIARQSKSGVEVIEGLAGILKSMDHLLTSEGIKEIEALGKPFNPSVHDAIAFLDSDVEEPNIVTTEIRKGYYLGEKVLRHSLVEVTRKIVKNTIPAFDNDASIKKGSA